MPEAAAVAAESEQPRSGVTFSIHLSRRALIQCAIVATAGIWIFAAFHPGLLSADPLDMLGQALASHFNSASAGSDQSGRSCCSNWAL
jgi:hypothetical protein